MTPHTKPTQPATHKSPFKPVREVRLGVLISRLLLVGVTAAGIVLEYGFHQPPITLWGIYAIQITFFAAYCTDVWLGHMQGRWSLLDDKPDWIDASLMIVAAIGQATHIAGLVPGGRHLFELAVVMLLIVEVWRMNVGLSRLFYRPGVLLPLSFLAMIGVGTVLLKLPLAVTPGSTITWLDALFTITSAVCVVGLTVCETATHFTMFGKAVIGVFIQVGGLGIIVFGSVLAMVLGSSFSLRENLSLKSMLSDHPLQHVTSLIRFIVLVTLLAELVGALVMWPMWQGDLTTGDRIGLSLFHAVSAYCNAGFSLLPDNLESFRYAPQTHLVIAPLIVIGGLGFPVLDNLWQILRAKLPRLRPRRYRRYTPHDPRARLNLHTKIVLYATAVLYLYGVMGILVGQIKPYVDSYFQPTAVTETAARPHLDASTFGGLLADASFMSISTRSAGFNTVPMDDLTTPSRFVIITLMMVGASPGSCGGGMKTTIAALLILTIVAVIRQRTSTEAFSRQINDQIVRRAATLASAYVALATFTTLLLMLSEPFSFEQVAFEAVSALGTVGLSLGITSQMTTFGKIVLIVTMFLGRVGPLALLGALMFRTLKMPAYSYPHEPVWMG